MRAKMTWTICALFLTAAALNACASGAPTREGLAVTSIPPVVYSTPVPTRAPTRMPLHTPTAPQQAPAPEVRAGEVDDNDRWAEYMAYRRDYRGPQVHDVDITERYIIAALDRSGLPILDAKVSVWNGQTLVWEGRTYADGRTSFFPRAFAVSGAGDFVVSVNKDGHAYTFDLQRGQQEVWPAQLGQYTRPSAGVKLDVLFLLDATGSMGDEIHALQSSMQSIAAQIDGLRPRPDLRFGLVWYRDRGDAFIVRATDFTDDVRRFSESLDAVTASGGGDYPESLNESLHVAVQGTNWREEEAVRLIFLLADAPPHLDYWQDYDYAQEMAVAAANGIKIFPIAASGTDEQAEYIFRQLAQFTQGRFLFLTYDEPGGAGEPGDVGDMTVSGYGVQDLDDLVVRLVRDELAHQGAGQ